MFSNEQNTAIAPQHIYKNKQQRDALKEISCNVHNNIDDIRRVNYDQKKPHNKSQIISDGNQYKRTPFWTKKTLQTNSHQHIPSITNVKPDYIEEMCGVSLDIKQKQSRSHINNIKIKQRNCLSACVDQSSNSGQNKQQQFTSMSKISNKRSFKNSRPKNNGEHIANNRKYRINSESSQQRHESQYQGENINIINTDMNKKQQLLIARQQQLAQQLQQIYTSKASLNKIPLQSILKSLNKILMSLAVNNQHSQQPQSTDIKTKHITQIMKTHIKLTETIFTKLQKYTQQYLQNLDYITILNHNKSLQKQNEEYRLELSALSHNINANNDNKQNDKQIEIMVKNRLCSLDIGKIYMAIKNTPLSRSQENVVREISKLRCMEITEQIMDDVVEMYGKVRGRESVSVSNANVSSVNVSKVSNVNVRNMKKHKQSIYTMYDQCDENYDINSDNRRSLRSRSSHNNPILEHTFPKHNLPQLQWTIITTLLPLPQTKSTNNNKNYHKQGLAVLDKILKAQPPHNSSQHLITQILQTKYLLPFPQSPSSFNQPLFSQICTTILKHSSKRSYKTQRQLSVMLQKCVIIKNKESIKSIILEISPEYGQKLLKYVVQEEEEKEQGKGENKDMRNIVMGNCSNQRLVNCFNLIESKKNGNVGNSGVMSIIKKYGDKSMVSLQDHQKYSQSNDELQNIIDKIQANHKNGKNNVKFFSNNDVKPTININLGQTACILYRFCRQQLQYIHKILQSHVLKSTKNHPLTPKLLLDIIHKILQIQLIPNIYPQQQVLTTNIQNLINLTTLTNNMHKLVQSQIEQMLKLLVSQIVDVRVQQAMYSRLE